MKVRIIDFDSVYRCFKNVSLITYEGGFVILTYENGKEVAYNSKDIQRVETEV